MTVVSGGVPDQVGTPGTGEYWYDGVTNTLYLNGIDLSTRYYDGYGAYYGLYAEGDLNIVVCDGTTNTVGSTDSARSFFYGICVEGVLSISGGTQGTGVLNAYASEDLRYAGIRGKDGLSIANVTLNAAAGGIGLVSPFGDVTIDRAVVVATAIPQLIYSLYGIDATGAVAITNSTVTATGPAAGLYAEGIAVSDSTVTATAKGAAGRSVDYYNFDTAAAFYTASGGGITLTDSAVTADNQIGSDGDGYALYAEGFILIDGGTLDADSAGMGIWADNINDDPVSLTFRGDAKVDVDAAGAFAVLAAPDVNFELTAGGYVDMSTVEYACIAGSPLTINLGADNVVASPAGASVGPLESFWFILDSEGAPVAAARIEGSAANPATGVSDLTFCLSVAALCAIVAAAAALVYVRRGKRTA